MHEVHNQLGEEVYFLWRRLITHPICSQYAWRAVRLVTEPRAGPARETCHILFRRKHCEAGDLSAGGKAGANRPPRQPLPSLPLKVQ